MTPHWVDQLTAPWAPRWTLKRQRSRIASELMQRHYEAASAGRRTQGWRRTGGDANAVTQSGLTVTREVVRDLIRNNPYAESALSTIVNDAVGWGISAATPDKTVQARWASWADTTACDADGRADLYGLQRLVMRTVAESGECLIRRRWRRPSDNLPLPVQLQVLEPDYLDTFKTTALANGSRIINGIEFGPYGRREAYWLFPEHPGTPVFGTGASVRIAASEILHVYRGGRPGQVRGMSWFAPVVLRLKDFDDYEDAALLKQKIAACLAVLTTDVDGTAPPLGTVDPTAPAVDMLEPGQILNLPPGRQVAVVDPPSISEHKEYAETVLRAIATGLGVTYEDLTGDYTDLPYSAARMSRIRYWTHVTDWREQMLVPQFCQPVWRWAMEAGSVIDVIRGAPVANWTAPPMPLLDPDKEGLAIARLVRIGAVTWPEMQRERGNDPDVVLREIQDWNAKFDAAGVVLDSDPRKTTQGGQPRLSEDYATPSNRERIAAVEALVRAGYDPDAALKVVGLPSIPHTGLPPVTVQPDREALPVPVGVNGNGTGNDEET